MGRACLFETLWSKNVQKNMRFWTIHVKSAFFDIHLKSVQLTTSPKLKTLMKMLDLAIQSVAGFIEQLYWTNLCIPRFAKRTDGKVYHNQRLDGDLWVSKLNTPPYPNNNLVTGMINRSWGAEELAEHLKALPIFPEVQFLTSMVWFTVTSNSSSRASDSLFWPLQAPDMHMVCRCI